MMNDGVSFKRIEASYCGKIGKSPNGTELMRLQNYFLAWSTDILGKEKSSNVELITVFSLKVMPCIIRDVNFNVNFLVWDNHFWHLYGLFLLSVKKYYNSPNSNEHVAAEKELKSILLLYLSCRFDEVPSLSRYIAEEYALLEASSFAYDRPYWLSDELLFSGNSGAYSVACMFGLCHELGHIAFREKIGIASEIKEKLINYCEVQLKLMQLNEEVDQALGRYETAPPIQKKIIHRLLDNRNNHFFEEICCDIIAIVMIAQSFSLEGYSEEAIIGLIGLLQSFFCFDWWRSTNEKMWKMYSDVYNDPIKNDFAFIDPEHQYYRYDESISEDLSYRMNIPLGCASTILGFELTNEVSAKTRDEFLPIIEQVNCYDLVEKVMIHYQRSHKDYDSQIKHRKRRDELIGWRRN